MTFYERYTKDLTEAQVELLELSTVLDETLEVSKGSENEADSTTNDVYIFSVSM